MGYGFGEWLTDESHFTLFPAETIVRNVHHRKSQTHLEQEIAPLQSLSSGFVE